MYKHSSSSSCRLWYHIMILHMDRFFRHRYIASGQGGQNSDVIVWSFQERSLLFRLSEHDHGVAFVDFSHDDRLLLSGGVPEDRKILIWDMSNGCIVSIVQHDPVPTTVAAWGGMVRCGMNA